MKKQYMKPTMRVVKIQQRSHILVGSPGSQTSMQMSGGTIDDEEDVW